MKPLALLLALAITCAPPPTGAFRLALLTDPYTETILEDAQPTSTSRGFDGITRGTDDAGVPIVCSGAEQAGANGAANIVVAAIDGSYVQRWGSNQGSEDVVCGVDFNDDGIRDVASASEGQNRIRIWFGPYVDTTPADGVNDTSPITLTHIPTGGSVSQAWIKLETADADCDGDQDLLAGGKRVGGNAAAWGWWEWTSGSSFTFHEQGAVGWTMALQAIDWDGDSPCRDDVLITDKLGAGGVGTERGAWRWLNNGSGTYTGTKIRQVNGDEQFGFARDLDFDDDTDVVHGTNSTIELLINNGAGFDVEVIPYPADTTAATFHAPILCPDSTINGPFFFTFALSVGPDSGVVLLRRVGGSWERQEVSGESGADGVTRKWDNGWCGFNSSGRRVLITTEGGDSTSSDDKGIVLFTEPT